MRMDGCVGLYSPASLVQISVPSLICGNELGLRLDFLEAERHTFAHAHLSLNCTHPHPHRVIGHLVCHTMISRCPRLDEGIDLRVRTTQLPLGAGHVCSIEWVVDDANLGVLGEEAKEKVRHCARVRENNNALKGAGSWWGGR